MSQCPLIHSIHLVSEWGGKDFPTQVWPPTKHMSQSDECSPLWPSGDRDWTRTHSAGDGLLRQLTVFPDRGHPKHSCALGALVPLSLRSPRFAAEQDDSCSPCQDLVPASGSDPSSMDFTVDADHRMCPSRDTGALARHLAVLRTSKLGKRRPVLVDVQYLSGVW